MTRADLAADGVVRVDRGRPPAARHRLLAPPMSSPQAHDLLVFQPCENPAGFHSARHRGRSAPGALPLRPRLCHQPTTGLYGGCGRSLEEIAAGPVTDAEQQRMVDRLLTGAASRAAARRGEAWRHGLLYYYLVIPAPS